VHILLATASRFSLDPEVPRPYNNKVFDVTILPDFKREGLKTGTFTKQEFGNQRVGHFNSSWKETRKGNIMIPSTISAFICRLPQRFFQQSPWLTVAVLQITAAVIVSCW
jgi:hypothetical protein